MTNQTNIGLARVERETVQERIYIALRDKLMRGGWEPGQGLKIAELAAAFGTSAMPVREALNRLTAERGLQALPNRTVRVPTLSQQQLFDLKEARFAIEGLAVARAASNRTTEALDDLWRIVEAQRTLDESHFSEASSEQNRFFHFTIYRQSGSTVLLPIIESLWLQFGPYLRSASERFDGRDGSGTKHHVAILDALGVRDAEAARAALEADIGRAFDLLTAADSRLKPHSGTA